jgi:hypothetical protein
VTEKERLRRASEHSLILYQTLSELEGVDVVDGAVAMTGEWGGYVFHVRKDGRWQLLRDGSRQAASEANE